MSKKTILPAHSADEELPRRFYILNAVVAVVLMAAIFISIYQFGAEAWHGRRQVALIISGTKNQVGWNSSHYLAVKNVCTELDFDLIVKENVLPTYEECKKAVDEAAARGAVIILLPNGCHLYDLEKFEKDYPKITFCTIETISALWSSGSYSILSYEVSYMAGILAGLHTKTNKIGYIAPFIDPEINQGINAFAIGAQRVNPNIEVLVNWTGGWDKPSSEEQAVQNLKAEHVDFLAYHQNGETIPNTAERAGIDFIAFNEVYPSNTRCIASITIDWKRMYKDLITYYRRNNLGGAYGFGLSNQMVDLKVSDRITKREQVLLDTARWEIENGRIIFAGEIFDRNGVQRCTANESISFQSLQKNMNWLVRGVKVIGN
ncbi:MAG: BMP family ABC transporter substrate-binding protein [Selenomonadaceae bacterium]|nr:BMP family ABC transporter substrate-binding protein [Selenomonadaceae bacterium]